MKIDVCPGEDLNLNSLSLVRLMKSSTFSEGLRGHIEGKKTLVMGKGSYRKISYTII